jgi:hypothetical protein
MTTSGSRSFNLVYVITKTRPQANGQDRAGKTAKEENEPLL